MAAGEVRIFVSSAGSPAREHALQGKAVFKDVFHLAVVEEALDSVLRSSDEEEEGFLKLSRAREDKLREGMLIDFLLFYQRASHYRLITRDEVIHVFSSQVPTVSVRRLVIRSDRLSS